VSLNFSKNTKFKDSNVKSVASWKLWRVGIGLVLSACGDLVA